MDLNKKYKMLLENKHHYNRFKNDVKKLLFIKRNLIFTKKAVKFC